MPVIHLIGGECDGHRQHTTHGRRPDVFYAVPMADLEKILREVKDRREREIAAQARRRLAYVFDKAVTVSGGEVEFRYVRCADQDKPLSSL